MLVSILALSAMAPSIRNPVMGNIRLASMGNGKDGFRRRPAGLRQVLRQSGWTTTRKNDQGTTSEKIPATCKRSWRATAFLPMCLSSWIPLDAMRGHHCPQSVTTHRALAGSLVGTFGGLRYRGGSPSLASLREAGFRRALDGKPGATSGCVD